MASTRVSPGSSQDTVDVSAANHNCFFHAYAGYLLTNDLPLPDDLFTKTPGGDPQAEALKEMITSKDDLAMFGEYEQRKSGANPPKDMLAEKTMVLGVLFRQWFINQLRNNEEYKGDEFAHFQYIVELAKERIAETQALLEREPIYQANREYISAILESPQEVSEDALRSYWEDEGYNNYCNHLAKPGVDVDVGEVTPVLGSLGVPYQIKVEKRGAEQFALQGGLLGGSPPLFKLVIDPEEGHYHLVASQEGMVEPLREWSQSMKTYRDERALVLAQEKALGDCQSLLLAAECPAGTFDDDLDPLLSTVREVHKENQVFNEQVAKVQQTLGGEGAPTDLMDKYKANIRQLLVAGRSKFSDESTVDSVEDLAQRAQEPGLSEEEQIRRDEELARALQDQEFEDVGLRKGPGS